MNLMRYTPFQEFENLFENWRWPLDEGRLEMRNAQRWLPSVDIEETDPSFVIKVEVPEVNREDLKVEVNQGVMTVSGERRAEAQDRKRHRSERYYGRFERSFTLPDNVREDGIRAEHKDGMLYIYMDKQDIGRKPRQLEIKPL